MRRSRGRGVQVDTLADFDRRIASGATSLRGWRIRALDLSDRTNELQHLRVSGALFLGCRFAAGAAELAQERGAIVVPELPAAPLDLHREHLYRPRDLYDAPAYADSTDARAYAWSQTDHGRDASLAKALHDHAVGGGDPSARPSPLARRAVVPARAAVKRRAGYRARHGRRAPHDPR